MSRVPAWLRIIIALSMSAAIAGASYATSHEVAFTAFYLAPVILTGWTGGIKPGIVVAACCASFQVLSKLLGVGELDKPVIDLGNALSQVVIFSAVLILVVRLKQAPAFSHLEPRRRLFMSVKHYESFLFLADLGPVAPHASAIARKSSGPAPDLVAVCTLSVRD
jgi:hypothetical protein